MQKLYSQLVRMGVCEEGIRNPIAYVSDIIIDPENGKVLAFLLQNLHIVVPMDIEHVGSSITILERERIVPMSEVLRVQEVYNMGIPLLASRVIAEHDATFIGRVFDYEIDTTHMVLKSIHVAKTFLLFHVQERIILSKHIVKISKNLIVVKDMPIAEEKAKAASRVLAT